jgi:trans-2,3-dihydro-3-hydroxyanthranilate isomerase
MPSYQFRTVDVFTTRRFGGNPLAVFPDARGISDHDMQRLAAEFNLSETTFVLPPDNPADTARVRIFNRTHEMPFAGHPMVGTAYVLAESADEYVETLRFEVPAGIVTVRLDRKDGTLHGATIDAPRSLSLGPQITCKWIAACVGLTSADVLISSHLPTEASVGNTYVIAEVTEAALHKAAPETAAFHKLLEAHPALNGRFSLYLYARADSEIHARMFAPLAGTSEDPATGSAATPLAALLLSISGRDNDAFLIHQGADMGRPSLLYTSAYRTSNGIHASVGGSCVPVLRGTVSL